MDILIERIFDLIKNKGVTAKEVAIATGIAQSSFTEWKNGRSKPGADAIRKLSEYFNVSTDYLLGRTDGQNMVVIEMDTIPERYRKAFEKLGVVGMEVIKEAVDEGLTASEFHDFLKALIKMNKSKK